MSKIVTYTDWLLIWRHHRRIVHNLTQFNHLEYRVHSLWETCSTCKKLGYQLDEMVEK